MKELKQFEEVLQRSVDQTKDCFCIKIEKEGAQVIGLSQQAKTVPTAILTLKLGDSFFTTGWIDQEYYQPSSEPIQIIVAVDLRKQSNQKIYVSVNDQIFKFGARSTDRFDDSLSLFWESELGAGMVICQYDATSEEMIRCIVSAPSDGLRKFLKADIIQKINLYSQLAKRREEKKQSDLPNDKEVKNESIEAR